MDDDLIQRSVQFPKPLFDKLSIIAKRQGMSFAAVVRDACIKYIEPSDPGLCSNCHTKNHPESHFCSNCGNPLTPEGNKIRGSVLSEYMSQSPEFRNMVNDQIQKSETLNSELSTIKNKLFRLMQASQVLDTIEKGIEDENFDNIHFQLINTDKGSVKIELHYPIDETVTKSPIIESWGRVIGIKSNGEYSIRAYVFTNQEYEQASSYIDTEGNWRIKTINLGSTTHKLFFRIFDDMDKILAKSLSVTVRKID